MIEILDDLDVLARSDLEPRTLSLAGVPFGSKAADTVDHHRVVSVSSSPLVYRMVCGDDIGAEYYGADGRRFRTAEVIDSVLDADGMVNFADKTGCKIVGGVVSGFALYGDEQGHLAHFGFLRSQADLLEVFGVPDLVEESFCTGELMGYHNHYWDSRKTAFWDSWDERLSLVNLGDYDRPGRPE